MPPPARRFAPMSARRAFILARHGHSDRGRLLRDVQRPQGRRHHDPGIDYPWRCSCCCSHGSHFPSCLRSRALPDAAASGRRTNSASIPPQPFRRSAAGPQFCCRPTTRIRIACWRDCARFIKSVEETGNGANFDWFVLSDTTDPRSGSPRKSVCLMLRQEIASAARIFYRHRPENTARKSGNIEEWIRRFGSDYECMLILDADSLMTGDTIVRLVAAMEGHPRWPDPDAADRRQCKVPVCAMAAIRRAIIRPAAGSGIAWWHGSEGNYWGAQRHHPRPCLCAVCRASRTAEDASRLADIFSSHDFVEAALMRRGGWAIHMAPKARRKLRGISAHAFGFCSARQALVPGQSAASGASSDTRLSLAFSASFADGYWIVSHRAALANLSGFRNPGIAAGAIRPARVLPERILSVSTMAGTGSYPGGLGFLRHDGDADRA